MDDTRLRFEAAKATATGDRPENQDRCLFLSSADSTLLCLADGLGGHPRGEVAAQLLLDVSEAAFRSAAKPLADPENFMLYCIGKAHNAILRFGQRQTPPIAPRTTAVIAVVQNGVAHWAHVGDSRLYLFRDGAVIAQTRDHSQVRFVRQSATEIPRPQASLTRCLGGLPQPPTVTCGAPTRLQHGDALLLCSDGLWGQVPKQALINAFDPCDAAMNERLRALLDLAATVPHSDNISAVALRWLVDDADAVATSEIAELVDDPALDRAIEQLEGVLKKSGKNSQD
ncbi:MAG: serine/threonine-protein phosphatase [Gammaproteobacteria bacterium]|nr:serine/threonine-protein phosphatase [Gammaproteobacteria bacterium]